MLAMDTINSKVHVLVSEKSNIAAVLRRGPSSWYHLMKWNLETDEFIHGAWIKARIYEDKCDISHDGRYLLYSAFKGNRQHTSYTNSYTVLSEIPSFKALALWPQGSTFLGGGRFLSETQIGIYVLPFMKPIHPSHTDTKGYTLENLEWSVEPHKNENLVTDADWSKKIFNNRQIVVSDYKIFIVENGVSRLFKDLTELKPPTVTHEETQ